MESRAWAPYPQDPSEDREPLGVGVGAHQEAAGTKKSQVLQKGASELLRLP